MTGNTKISVGLIGAGFIGKIHAANLCRHAEVELRYVAETNEEVGRLVADAAGATWLATADRIFEDPSLEAVWIAAPAASHSDLIRRAAAAGKAIFCEKPVGIEMNDVDRLVAELRGYRKPIFIGFNRRFDESHARLKQLVDDGAVGAVEMVIITSRDPNPPSAAYMKATPGGIFYDTMIHDFDIARWLLGEEPVELYATASCHLDAALNPDREFDAATATLKVAGGAVCQISVSRRAVYGYDQRIEVFGSKGMVQSANHHQSNIRLFGDTWISQDPLKNFFTARYSTAYVREIDTFVAACRGHRADYPGVVDGRQALHLSMEALRSSRTGDPVKLEPMELLLPQMGVA